MNFHLLSIVVMSIILQTNALNLTRCELIQELRNQHFPDDKMRDWVCLVEQESARQTDVVSKPNKNGSRDYGLYQINDNFWCSNTTAPGKDCNTTCSALTTDDITEASRCAKFIFQRQGFHAWHGWTKRCQKGLPDISVCNSISNETESDFA